LAAHGNNLRFVHAICDQFTATAERSGWLGEQQGYDQDGRCNEKLLARIDHDISRSILPQMTGAYRSRLW
jgi:hypothetical protein